MKKYFLFIAISLLPFFGFAQYGYWQQHVNYVMDVNLNVQTNIVKGTEKIAYTNNSFDKLDKVFFHLYWNAFQPGSEMDVRSRELGKIKIFGSPDWDSRVTDRISKLSPSEEGYQKIISLKMNGVEQPVKLHETILEVDLTKPILSKTTVNFEVVFEAQVPIQIRRSGRDNAEGVRYSMSQWYPKLCEYDNEGWHTAQYVAREFYGVWGNFDVKITLDKNYKIGATGVLQNAAAIGWGYDRPGTALKPVSGQNRMWHFVGKNVHDFVWAADPDYEHLVRNREGVMLNIIYKKKDSANDKLWEKVADAAYTVLPYLNKRFGKYPYPVYSFIQGGDGGMEYPMATLLKGPGLGTVFHEWMHSWYQMMMATDEAQHPWMDEGFTSWAEGEVSSYYEKVTRTYKTDQPLPVNHASAYRGYFALMKTGLAEPMATFSDHYNTNFGYSINAYSKGEMFLEQLGYIVGDSVRDRIMLAYYNKWRFKHPKPGDFVKVAKDVSGLQLNWYKEYWINTIKTIDYGIDSLWEANGKTIIRLRRIGQMPMPIDLKLTFKDSTSEMDYIPLDMMLGGKPAKKGEKRIVHEEWNWTNPTYDVLIDRKLFDLKKVEIDPTKRMADVNPDNNVLDLKW
ncbi:MAG: M1 family metallopeptidase [Chitinophagaceae bacterium]|nr:M1 family metallopeptidase [Chitinophagaceae bacterium]